MEVRNFDIVLLDLPVLELNSIEEIDSSSCITSHPVDSLKCFINVEFENSPIIMIYNKILDNLQPPLAYELEISVGDKVQIFNKDFLLTGKVKNIFIGGNNNFTSNNVILTDCSYEGSYEQFHKGDCDYFNWAIASHPKIVSKIDVGIDEPKIDWMLCEMYFYCKELLIASGINFDENYNKLLFSQIKVLYETFKEEME